MAKLIWGADLYKGFKLDKNNALTLGNVADILPFQMLTQEEKTIDWIKAVADYYDICGWRNVEKKAGKIQRNFWMRYGKLDPNDYIVGGGNQFAAAVGWLTPPESQSPLEQFYPLAPNFVDVLRGEFIKRDNRWTVEAIDPMSQSQAFESKKNQFEEALTQFAQYQKAESLAKMGLTGESDPQQYEQQMQQAMQQFTQIELNSKNFRTTGVKWAEKVLEIHEKRYNLAELEPDGFESGLITDSEFWHIDLLDDDFRIELLNSKYCDYHKGPNVKYVSEGDYFLWFDFMSAGDIVNKFGRKMKEEDILKLKDVYIQTSSMIVPDYLKGRQGAYYDLTKNWSEATDLNPAMNDYMLGKEMAYSYMRTPNFDHNIDTDLFSPLNGRLSTGHPQMFRVMRLYWRSMKRIGWLTKILRDGTRMQPDWVDENFLVTVEPEYDTSIVKEKTKDNLLYGEHIDWTWAPDWRHVMKIAPNMQHSYWNDKNKMTCIYIDGGPVPFQFKGRDNPFDGLPPVEGCSFSYINTSPHSFIDRIRPIQIIYNICMNKVPKKFLADYGNKVAIDRRSFSTNHLSDSTKGVDPVEEYEDKLRNSDILDYHLSREALEGLGQPALPQVLQLSTVQEAQMYFRLGQEIKMEAGELVGITRQRLGKNMASDTATNTNQSIAYSETQTEKYYEQHSNLMQRFRQRMLDAAQYYSTFSETSRDIYMNEMDENVFLEIAGTENLLPHYNINLVSRANVRAALQTISQYLQNDNTLPIKPSAKIEAIVGNNLPKIMSLIRQAELEEEQRNQQEQQLQQQMQQEQIAAQQEMAQQKMAFDADQNERNRQTQIDVATIRADASLASSATVDNDDPQSAIANQLKQQELIDKRRISDDANNAKRQTEIDKLNVEREKSQNDLTGERIRAKSAIDVAKENRTAAEMKKKSKK